MDKNFLGKGWSFPPTFHVHNQRGVDMVQGEEDIRQSIELILTTSEGERLFLPEFGCGINRFLFSPNSNSNSQRIKKSIFNALTKNEPRIKVNDVLLDFDQYLDGIVKISVDYSVVATNTRFNLVFPFYKDEGTDIPNLYRTELKVNNP